MQLVSQLVYLIHTRIEGQGAENKFLIVPDIFLFLSLKNLLWFSFQIFFLLLFYKEFLLWKTRVLFALQVVWNSFPLTFWG